MPRTRRSSMLNGLSKSPLKEKNVTPKKVDKRKKKRSINDRSPARETRHRKKTVSSLDMDNKENSTPTRPNEAEVVQQATPYWKVAGERGASPRITRSSVKRSIMTSCVDDSDKAEVAKGLFQCEVSSPKQVEDNRSELHVAKERDAKLKKYNNQRKSIALLSPSFRNKLENGEISKKSNIYMESISNEGNSPLKDDTLIQALSDLSPTSYTSSPFNDLKKRLHETEKENISLKTENVMLNKSLAKAEQELEKTRSAKESLIAEKTMIEGQVNAFLNSEWKKDDQNILCHARENQTKGRLLNSSKSESEIRSRLEEFEKEFLRLYNMIKEKDSVMKKQVRENKELKAVVQKGDEQVKSLKLQLHDETSKLAIFKERNEVLVFNHQKDKQEHEAMSKVAIENLSKQEAKLKELSKQHKLDQDAIADNRNEISTLNGKVSIYEEEIKYAKEELDALSAKNEESETIVMRLKGENQSYIKEILNVKDENNDLKILVKDMRSDIKDIKSKHENAEIAVATMTSDIAEKDTRISKIMEQIYSFNARESELLQKIGLQEEVRRRLHNRVMQLSGNIRVFIRVRPCIPCEQTLEKRPSPFSFPSLLDMERDSSSSSSVNIGDNLTKSFIIATEPVKDRGGLSQRRKRMKFGFDNVFSPNSNQEDVWKATEPLVQSAVDGHNVCVFAYGQTGSGKTYTMLGKTESRMGLVLKSVQTLFNAKKTIEDTSQGEKTVEISIELLEIYNEQVRDILSVPKNGKYNNLNISVNSNEAIGNVVFTASSEHELFSVMTKAQKRRCVKATGMNEESSRSHLLITMNFMVKNSSGTLRKGKLHICDLAGSERLSKSHASESTLNETKHINKSLSILSNVIEKLQQKSKHIPFRESKLTYLLRNSLGGDSKTLAIVCCNPLAEHFQESCSSLRFAHKLSNVELKSLGNISF